MVLSLCVYFDLRFSSPLEQDRVCLNVNRPRRFTSFRTYNRFPTNDNNSLPLSFSLYLSPLGLIDRTHRKYFHSVFFNFIPTVTLTNLTGAPSKSAEGASLEELATRWGVEKGTSEKSGGVTQKGPQALQLPGGLKTQDE